MATTRTREASPPRPKDAEELELEKLVFGDAAGFREGLQQNITTLYASDDDEDDHDAGFFIDDADEKRGKELALLQDEQLFFVDEGEAGDDVEMGGMELEKAEKKEEGPKEAWVDSDDERIVVSLKNEKRNRKLRDAEAEDMVSGREYARRLRRQFERIYPVPEWAQPEKPSKRRRRDGESDSESEEESGLQEILNAPSLSLLLQTTASLTAPKSARLRPEVLDVARLTDANHAAPSKSSIQALSFHPTHPLLLTSGLDSTLRLYHIDGKTNPPATSLHIRHSPLTVAAFHPDGARIVSGGRRRYFHVWDLASGKVERISNVYGHKEVQKSMEQLKVSPDGQHLALIGARGTVQILDAATCQWVATAKVEDLVADVAWHPNGQTLTIANKAGELYEYSVAARKVTHIWRDEGGVNLTVVANSPTGRFVAVGSAAGIVNIYDRHISFGGKNVGALGSPEDPKPVRTVENIVTSISVLEFSRDGQILCVASAAKKDALRLVHLPSCTVYKNWPTGQTPLGKVTAVAWGGTEMNVLAVGNEQGRVRLFEIRGN